MAFNPSDLEYMGQSSAGISCRDDAILWRYNRPDETSETIFNQNYAVDDMTASQKIRSEDVVWVTASDGDYIARLYKEQTSLPPPVGPYRYLRFSNVYKVDAAALNFGDIY